MARKKNLSNSEPKIIPTQWKKDNGMIVSRSTMTLLGRKIYDAGTMVVREVKDSDGIPVLKSELNVSDLRVILDCDNNDIYSRIKGLIKPKPQVGKGSKSPSLLDWKIIAVDDKNQNISGVNIITDVKFSNGHLSITWNKVLRAKLIDVNKNFTLLDKNILSHFKSNYSYLTYQLLKKTIDREIWEAKTKHNIILNKTDRFELKMDLVDLKLFYGIVDASVDDALYSAASDNTIETYDVLSSISDVSLVNTLSEYRNFRRYALERAKKDINELSDISMEYEPIKAKLGGKVVGVRFIMSYKAQTVEDTVISTSEEKTEHDSVDVDIFEFIDSMREFMTDTNCTTKELKSIAEAADFDIEKIKTAYKILCLPHSNDIGNPARYMIQLIKTNAQEPKPRKASLKTAKSGQMYFNFEQRDVDYDEIVNKKILKRMSSSNDN